MGLAAYGGISVIQSRWLIIENFGQVQHLQEPWEHFGPLRATPEASC